MATANVQQGEAQAPAIFADEASAAVALERLRQLELRLLPDLALDYELKRTALEKEASAIRTALETFFTDRKAVYFPKGKSSTFRGHKISFRTSAAKIEPVVGFSRADIAALLRKSVKFQHCVKETVSTTTKTDLNQDALLKLTPRQLADHNLKLVPPHDTFNVSFG